MLIKESPDYLDANLNGKTYELTLDSKYNPITFIHTQKIDIFNYNQRITTNFGPVTIYAPTVIPLGANFHSHITNRILSRKNNLSQLRQKYGIDIFVHDEKKQDLFEQYQKQYPKLSIDLLSPITLQDTGRVWSVPDAIIFAMWELQKDTITNITVPFLKFLYSNISDKNIYFQRADGEPVQPLSKLQGTQELKPYEKELAGWLAQLHIASGDEERKAEIKSEIEDIVKKHGLDPKKYGIGVEVPKSSEYTQKKQLGKSKMSMAELKSKERTSESSIITFREYYIQEKSIHDPVRPGILKRQVKGKMTCSKARSLKSKQKNKGNNTAKAAQRYLNYHC